MRSTGSRQGRSWNRGRRRDREAVPGPGGQVRGVLHVESEGHGGGRSFEEERTRSDEEIPADALGATQAHQ